jgi:hypothetical protein
LVNTDPPPSSLSPLQEPLIRLASSKNVGIQVEAIAALANLAVNGNTSQMYANIIILLTIRCIYTYICLYSTLDLNELEIARMGGLKPIIDALEFKDYELLCQAARALRNLSVNSKNHPLSLSPPLASHSNHTHM